jgi:hypothetical protein
MQFPSKTSCLSKHKNTLDKQKSLCKEKRGCAGDIST